MNSNTQLPRWDLSSLFSSIDSTEYKNAVAKYKNSIKELSELIIKAESSSDFAEWLSEYIKKDEDVATLAKTLGAFSYIIYSVETTNTKYLNNISEIEEIGLEYEQVQIKFQKILCKNSSALNEFYTRFPEFKEYAFLLKEMIEDSSHQMTPEEENLASDLQRTGGNAWDRLHEQIISNLKTIEGKTFNTLRNDAYSKDASLRKKSYEEEKLLLKQNEIAFAACLNNLKGETVTLNKRRHWKNAIDRALFSNRLSIDTLNALISAIETSLPVWREYFQLKAKYLRKNKMTASKSTSNGIAFYDLFAPLQQKDFPSKIWTFEEAKNYVIQQYSSFSQDMGVFAKKAFDFGWIDAEIRQGKVGGAYDEDFPLNHESRILTNFTGAFSDIITLAHELGHAYHFNCMKEKPCSFSDYPMTLAETASTFAETIVKQDMLKKAGDAEKLFILDADLQDVSQVLVDILCRFYFEKKVFEERSNGELSSEDFCRIMKEAQEKSYGKGLNEERHEYMWAVKSHYYSTDLDFYNFPYAFGQLFAACLYMRYKNENDSFVHKYPQLLSMTGSMNCEDLCKQAGFDITNTDFWLSGIEMYRNEINSFKKLI